MALVETAREGLRSELQQKLSGLLHPDQEAAALQAFAALAELPFAPPLAGPSPDNMKPAIPKIPLPVSSGHPAHAEQF